jgi:hypothetical protein
MAKILIACEFTGTVRREFARYEEHDVWSCDLLPALDRSNRHIVGDVRSILGEGWDLMMVAHPPCQRLCNSGVRWLKSPPTKLSSDYYSADEIAAYARMTKRQRLAFMWHKLDEGAALFSDLLNAPIEHIAIENPVMHRYAKQKIANYVEFAQSVQPWQFGHGEIKRTCLWLKKLPSLKPTKIVKGRVARVHLAAPGPERWKERSKFFPGIGAAMADQWTPILRETELRRAA